MIEILKKRVEEKIGKPVKTRGDCELVSNAILETLDIDISYSTIKRLYGLATFTKPNSKTTNTLAQFVGYKNYAHFSQTHGHKVKSNKSLLIYRTIAEDDEEELLNIVNETKKSSEEFLSLVIIIVRELLHNENYILVDKIFKLKALEFNSFSYYEALTLGNAVGVLIRRKSKLAPLLLSNINFLDCVFLTFVDYSSLNKYYGDSLELIENNKIREDIALFSKSLIEFRNFLNNKPVNEINTNAIHKRKLHPILTGRLLAVKLLATNSSENLELLKVQFSSIKGSGSLLSYYYELFTTAILLKNIELMSFLISETTSKIEFYFQKSHLNSFYLMCLFYFRLTGDEENESNFLKLFKLEECRDSYKEFIKLIHLVYQFNSLTENPKKKKVKNTYLQLSKELKYPFFSNDFLLNYFN